MKARNQNLRWNFPKKTPEKSIVGKELLWDFCFRQRKRIFGQMTRKRQLTDFFEGQFNLGDLNSKT